MGRVTLAWAHMAETGTAMFDTRCLPKTVGWTRLFTGVGFFDATLTTTGSAMLTDLFAVDDAGSCMSEMSTVVKRGIDGSAEAWLSAWVSIRLMTEEPDEELVEEVMGLAVEAVEAAVGAVGRLVVEELTTEMVEEATAGLLIGSFFCFPLESDDDGGRSGFLFKTKDAGCDDRIAHIA